MKLSPLTLLCLAVTFTVQAQSFAVKDSGIFVPQSKKIVLFSNNNSQQILLFKSNLQVNTDGVPISYHPYDLRGDSLAINSILNAAAIYRISDNVRISNPKKPNTYTATEKKAMAAEAYTVFEKYRDSGFDSVPKGYTIRWQNVLVPINNKPCIFDSGAYKGYFASATALTNGLQTNKGECDCNNQVNPFEVPTLVLAGGDHMLKQHGAHVGDLVVAYNLNSKALVYAIIGDTGPADNLGEGSVALNMALLGITNFPTNRRETYNLATHKNIAVLIIPKSKTYKLQKPYTAQNIKSRIQEWFAEQGYANEQAIADFFEQHKNRFN